MTMANKADTTAAPAAPHGPASSARLGYRPALDGIRGIAILLVLGFHSQLFFLRGGQLGVDIFFVLSGFLITCLLLEEWQREGAIRLKAFYVRRVLRLFPALFVALAVWALWAAYQSGDTGLIPRTVCAVLLYCTNLVLAFGGLTALAGFAHSWSLSAEEQFYLIWPACLWFLLRRGFSRRTIVCLLLGLVAAVNLYSPLLWEGNGSWVRLYFGPDTHSAPLLIGCAAALLFHSRGWSFVGWRAFVLGVLFVLSAGVLCGLAVFVGDETAFLYYGGFTLIAIASAILTLGALQANWWTTRLLDFTPLVWLGRLSYSLYLWHVLAYSFFEEATRGISLRWSLAKLLPNVLALLLAGLSYVIVERPFLRLKDRFNYSLKQERPIAQRVADGAPATQPI
jgi:peptidoglycan/LPS O-acetylase OafA/YrhL